MVICKYFLSGSCKFGSNCSFEHPQNQNPASRYKYVNPTYNKTTNQPTLDHDVTQYMDLVKSDAFQWLNSSQWKFSCYSPFNSDKSIPLFEEYSTEELRYETYKSRKTNTFSQTIDEITRKKNTILNYLKEIINLTPQMRDVLIKYYDENKSPKNISNQVTQTTTTNKFADLVQKASLSNAVSNSQVNSSGNIFSLATNQSQTAQTSKPLVSLSASSQNAFTTMSSQNQFTQLIFASQNLSQQQHHQQILPNPFTQLSIPNKIDFGKQPEQSNTALFPFGQATQNKVEQNSFTNIMNHQNSNNQGANLQSTSTIVTQPSMNNNNNNNAFSALMLKNTNSNNNQIQSSYYSNKSELNVQDIQEYSADNFTLGKIPILPPPKDFC